MAELAPARAEASALRVSAERGRSPLARALRRLLQNRSAQLGMSILAALVFVAVFADVIAPYAYDQQIRQPGCAAAALRAFTCSAAIQASPNSSWV